MNLQTGASQLKPYNSTFHSVTYIYVIFAVSQLCLVAFCIRFYFKGSFCETLFRNIRRTQGDRLNKLLMFTVISSSAAQSLLILAKNLTFTRYLMQATFFDASTNTTASHSRYITLFRSRDNEGIQVALNRSSNSPIMVSEPSALPDF